MRKATYQTRERGKRVSVALVSDDQRCDPHLWCPENGSTGFLRELHLVQNRQRPFACCVATQIRSCLPASGEQGIYLFPIETEQLNQLSSANEKKQEDKCQRTIIPWVVTWLTCIFL